MLHRDFNRSPDPERVPKESAGIAEVAERLIMHMDRSRRLYVLLIVASFASVATSLAFVGLMLAPGGVPATGPDYEFYPDTAGDPSAYPGGGLLGSFDGSFEGRLLGESDGSAGPYYGEFVGSFGGRDASMSGEFAGSFDGRFERFGDGAGSFGVYEGTFEGEFRGAFYGMQDPGEFAASLENDEAGYEVVYIPEYDGTPLFLASGGDGPPTDITSALAGFLGATAGISMLVLYVGLRESMFYSDWAPRFRRFREQREQIERDLESTPSS